MNFSAFLDNAQNLLVIDSSVAINLRASERPVELLLSLDKQIVIPEAAFLELCQKTGGLDDKAFIEQLVGQKLLSIERLTENESDIFVSLVSGRNSIGDGEAATIAIAKTRHGSCLLDDRRGRNRAVEIAPQMLVGWSLDLFENKNLLSKLSESEIADALFSALRGGRMRIDPCRLTSVVELIGLEKAIQCSSLPDFKNNMLKWKQLLAAE